MPKFRRNMDNASGTRAVMLIGTGHSQRDVALQLEFSRRAMQNLWSRYQETGCVSRRHASRRVHATTVHEGC